jgi:predicted amidohydrolase
MPTWKIATVQMDCKLADRSANFDAIRARLHEAAGGGAQVVIFPECALTGYCFESKEEAWPMAVPLPGPTTVALTADCKRLGVWAVVGLLERDGDRLFNALALIGPEGLEATYRKAHLPFLGVDRFTTSGDRPFAVHDLGGLRIGLSICYDGSFPETSRVLMLLGADLVILSTNWPTAAMNTVKYLVQPRAMENQVYFAACNRVGEERGFHFIGRSRIVDVSGELLAASDDDRPAILYADVDPERARNKHIIKIPGAYELHRTGDRRPDLYGPLCRPVEREGRR